MEVWKDTTTGIIPNGTVCPCSVTMENCLELLTAAKTQRLPDLQERTDRFMSDHFLEVLRSPGLYGRLTAAERERILARRMEGRRLLAVAEIDEVSERVAGSSRPPSRESSRPQSPLAPGLAPGLEEHRRSIYRFDETTKEWRVLTRLPEQVPPQGAALCTLFNYLFVAGGVTGGVASDQVFCYNPLTDTWSRARPLRQARSQLRLVSLDGLLFAVAGECLLSVERYDPRTDRWSAAAPLPGGAFAVAHEAAACDGELFVSGGSLFYRLLRYDPRRDEWEECPFNTSRTRSTDMVAHRGFLYRFDVHRERVHVFKYNTVVKIWHEGASFPVHAPRPFRCAVLGNRIYCVGKTRILQFQVDGDRESFLQETLEAPQAPGGDRGLAPFALTLPKED